MGVPLEVNKKSWFTSAQSIPVFGVCLRVITYWILLYNLPLGLSYEKTLCSMWAKARIKFPTLAQQPLVGQGVLIVEAIWTHWDKPHSVGLLWMSDQPDAETSTWQHTTLTRGHPCLLPVFEPTNPAFGRPQTNAMARSQRSVRHKFVYINTW